MESRVQDRTAALTKANELLERIFSSIHLMIAYLDKDFNFIQVNRAYAEADERDPGFFVGKNHFALYPNEENEAIFRRVVETGQPYSTFEKPFEYPEHPERGVTYWDWSLQPVKEVDGKMSGVILILINVTDRKQTQEAHSRLISILEATPDFVGMATKEGRILYLNQAARKMMGVSGEEDVTQLRAPETYPPWARDFVMGEGIRTAFRSGIWSGDTALLTRDGREIPVSQVILAHRSPNKKVEYLSTIIRDITERKEEETRIRITSALLEQFSKSTSRKKYLDAVVDLLGLWSKCQCVGIRMLDDERHIPYESYRGFSQKFLKSENWLSLNHDQCVCIRVIQGKIDSQDASVTTPVGSFRCENISGFFAHLTKAEHGRFRGRCAREGFLSVAIIPIHYRNEILGTIHLADEKENMVPARVVEFIETLTPFIGEAVKRFNLEDRIRESEKQLRTLSSQLLTAQETERKRIALEIHDGIGQSLTAFKIRLENILQQTGGKTSKASARSLQSLIPIVQESIREARRIQMDLRPSILDDLRVLATLSWFCREFEKTYSHISIEKELNVEESSIPDSLKTVIYRITQEAFNNIAKHSKASRIDLSLVKRSDAIELLIWDNGQGFDVRKALSARGTVRGLGLTSIIERAELSGGHISIDSKQGTGTRINAVWAL